MNEKIRGAGCLTLHSFFAKTEAKKLLLQLLNTDLHNNVLLLSCQTNKMTKYMTKKSKSDYFFDLCQTNKMTRYTTNKKKLEVRLLC